VNVLLWHVHGSWTTALVQGDHRFVVPVLPDRGPDGRGRARTWRWPDSVHEVTPSALPNEPVDVVILQRPHELDLVAEWLGRRPGRDVPAVYVEHNAPQGRIAEMRHPLAARDDIPIVHVTHFNRLFWDSGRAPTRVIEHGIVDPGYRYSGAEAAAGVVINEPSRRGRVTGTDLLPFFRERFPVRLFGMRSEEEGGTDLAQDAMHDALASLRVYLHPIRWTSLGLSLIEAMALGMPVAALATTEVATAVPPEAGFTATDPESLRRDVERLLADRERCTAMGRAAREYVLGRFGLDRFLADWDLELKEAVA
jgi:glycosyltransferase involved in cell wall biosynthesis